MIGRAGTTLRTIVEDKHLLQLRGDLHHVLIVVENLLFAMMTQRNGEVLGENRVRIQQQVIFLQQRTTDLFRRAIHFAEETGALLDALCIHLRTSRNNAGRVVLSHQLTAIGLHLRRHHIGQFLIPFLGFLPHRQLLII